MFPPLTWEDRFLIALIVVSVMFLEALWER